MNTIIHRSTAFACALTLLVGLSLTGCSKSGPDRLVGTWGIDVDAVRAELAEQSAEGTGLEAMGAQMAEAMVGMMAGIRFTFESDGTASVSMMGQVKSGTYEVTAVNGDTMTVTLTEEDGETETMEMTFENGDRIRTGMNEQTVYLVRQ